MTRKGKGKKVKKGKTCKQQILRYCEFCESKDAGKRCGGCRMSWYCSTQCQIMDWKQGGHKQKCRALLQSTAEEAQKNRSIHVARRAKDLSDAQAEEAEPLICAICLGPPEDTAELPCGHEFCKACIDALRKFGVQKACPLCRKPLPPSAERLCEQATRLYIKVSRRVSRKRYPGD